MACASLYFAHFAIPARADKSEEGIQWKGPGTFVLTRVGGSTGAVNKIELSQTTKASTLTIKVDPDKGGNADNVEVRKIKGLTPLKAIVAPSSNLTMAIALPGGVGTVTLADVGAGVGFASGANTRLKQLRFTAR